MQALSTLKTFLARLAGVPDAASHPPPVIRARSHLYDDVDRAPARPRTSRQRDGDDAEAYARRYLERAGLTFVAGNVRFRDGEIDLVMREQPRASLSTPSLVFVEVRRRAHAGHGGAVGSVTFAKRRRIVAAAAHYLVGLGLRTLPPSRFDVVTIDGDASRGFRVAWIRDAFRDEG